MIVRKESFLALFFTILSMAVAGTPVAKEIDPHDSRILFVRKLIETSSVAKRVGASEDPEVRALHEKAREHYRKAVRLHESGDHDGTDIELMAATEAMFSAVRLTEERKDKLGKAERELERKAASVRALLAAHSRIAREKGANGGNGELRKAAETKLKAAQQLQEEGDFEEARRYLNEAYLAIKLAVSELRDGDTLVRSLKFASKEEEYHYEIDRNDTHRMLVKLLLKERVKNEGTRNMVRSFVDKAAELRAKAETLAKKGDYAQAVEMLEKSTRQLVRAIRSAGIFIPG